MTDARDLCKTPALVLNVRDAGLVERIAAASEEPAYRFAEFDFSNRPVASSEIKTVALHYWVYGIGGGEKVTKALLELFVAQGYRVILYVDSMSDRHDLGLPEGVVRKVVPSESKEARVRFWLDEVPREHIDLLIYGTWLSGWAPADLLSVEAAGATTVYHTHGHVGGIVGVVGQDWLFETYERCAHIADLVVTLSAEDCAFTRGLNANTRAVPNPVSLYLGDVAPVLRAPETKTVVFCGRLVFSEKGLDSILQAFAEAHRLDADMRLKLIGPADNDTLDQINQICGDLNISDAVECTGPLGDPLPVMRACSVLVMASPSEGFPLVLSEAAAIGLPAVMFRLPYLTLVQDNDGVIQVPQGDIEGLGRAMYAVCNNRELQEHMRASMRATYDRVCCVDFAHLWEDLCAQARQAHAHPSVKIPNDLDGTVRHAQAIIDTYHRAFKRTCDVQSELAEAWHTIERLEEELSAARAAAEDVKRSNSWRVGRVVTAPVRAIKKLLKTSSA